MKRMLFAAVVLLGGACLGGCGGASWTLYYKPLGSARVDVPFPSACERNENVAVFVAPEARRVIAGEAGKEADQQELIVEFMVKNERDEAITFQARNVSVSVEGDVGRATEAFEAVLKPGENTGRYELHIPVGGRGKKDPREDKVELVVEVKGMSSGQTVTVRMPLLFVVSEVK